jgi:hypothetical protein
MTNTGGSIIPAKEFEGKLWILSDAYQLAMQAAYMGGVLAEREACASIEVHLTTPDRDYTNISPLDAYETALMDAAMAFREAIRSRGQE